MASIRIEEDALAKVAQLVEEFGRACAPAVPMLMVHWQGPSVDNQRGPQGQAVWLQSSPAGWALDICGWIDTPERKISETALNVQGLYAILDHKASSSPGCFVISWVNNHLVLELATE